MFYALLLFTGMRHGEAAGRRWRDLDEGSLPLSALAVSTQYEDVPLKTGVPRVVPVHGSLAALLTHWRFSGFERFLGRPPSLDDFIVPSRLARCRAAGTTRRNLQRDCRTIAVTPRRTHDTRHTFISHARRDGARSDVLQRITHNARCDVLDQYTHVEWEPLCEAVSRLRL